MCKNGGHTFRSVPNMKFQSLNLWLGEVCTENLNDNDANNDDAIDDKERRTKNQMCFI